MIRDALTWPLRAIRKLYLWTISLSRRRSAAWALFFIAFAESSVFPIPPDVLLIALVIGDPRRWWQNAAICTAGSVAGALLGYLIGWTFFEAVGRTIVEFYRLEAALEYVGQKYSENAFLTVFTAAFTPIPYKAITLGAGLFKIPLSVLILASLLGRAGRFFLVAGLLNIYGPSIKELIEKYFNLFTVVFVILLIGGFVLLRYL